MASAFPGALDAFATNKSDATVTATDHPAHHNDMADAINNIEPKLGTGADTPVAGDFLQGTGAGASGWSPWALAVASQTGTFTAAFMTIHACDASGGAFTANLPTAVGNTGRIIAIKKTDSSANAVTVDGSGSQTIDGQTTVALPLQWDSVILISNGANWLAI